MLGFYMGKEKRKAMLVESSKDKAGNRLRRMGRWKKANVGDVDVTRNSRCAFSEPSKEFTMCYDDGGGMTRKLFRHLIS